MYKKPKWKIGDNVLNRIICEIVPCLDYAGRPSFKYGYRYQHEPKDIDLIYCQESTLLRKTYKK